LPAPPGVNPFDPPPPHDVDPPNSPFIVTENRSGQSGEEPGGLPGLLLAMMRQGQVQPGADSLSTQNQAPEYSPGTSFNPQGGLLSRLLSLQAEQGRYQSILENSGQAPSVPRDPNFRQLVRMPNGTPLPMPGSPEPPAEATMTQTQSQYEADQAQQARAVAAARLARGVRNLARAEATTVDLDPIDAAKSAGIGAARGLISAAGMAGDLQNIVQGPGVSDWLSRKTEQHLPTTAAFLKSETERTLRGGIARALAEGNGDMRGMIPFPASGAIQKSIEGQTGEFYRPKTTVGRYAETIGEFAPMAAVGSGAPAAGGVLRDLGVALAKHAVAPGVVVQGLEEALPDSQVGQTIQKAYPAIRRGLPLALAAQRRYLGKRVVPQ
jgi:hypothetical protein